jgi:hypothetical protein
MNTGPHRSVFCAALETGVRGDTIHYRSAVRPFIAPLPCQLTSGLSRNLMLAGIRGYGNRPGHVESCHPYASPSTA